MSDERKPQYAGDLHGTGDGTRSSRRKSTRWIWGMVALGIVFGLVIVGLMKFVSDPVTAAGSTTLEQVKATPTPTPLPTNLFAGKMIQFSYSGLFDTVTALDNDHEAYDQYMISSKTEYRRTIAVDVRPLDSGTAHDDASYRIRELHPETYTHSTVTLGKETGDLMTKTDGTEQTLFWAHAGKLATVSIASTAPNDTITAYMKTVVASIRWRE